MYIIMESSAKPVQCRAGWSAPTCNLAVVEIEEGFVGRPKMISERARGVKRIVRRWERLYADGKTLRSERGRAKAEARELCDRLNKEAVIA